MNWKITDHSTAGGASWGSQLAPGSFYLAANLRESNRTKTKPKKPFTQLSLQNQLLRPISSRTALRRDRLRLKIALPDGTGTFRPPATSLSRFPGTSAGPQTRADGGRPEVLISVLTPAGASTIMRE